MRRSALAAVAAVLLLALTAAAAAAHRVPGPRGHAALRHAVERSHLVPPSIRAGHFAMRHPIVSTEGPWAKGRIDPSGHTMDSVLALFRHRRSGWHVRVLGTFSVGCDHPRLRRVVRLDLDLIC